MVFTNYLILQLSFTDNVGSQYLKKGEAFLGSPAENNAEVQSDSTTSFFILLAIFFPSVTGLLLELSYFDSGLILYKLVNGFLVFLPTLQELWQVLIDQEI